MAVPDAPPTDERPERPLDVSVVLPTYDEAGSLPGLIPRILRVLGDAGLRGEVIVVDDASPDGTAEVAEQLAREHPVRVLRRSQERGLATAVLAGFARSTATVCVVMDADGSHPVEALPGMVRAILADQAELVVGSRHVAGGGSRDWPLFSQLKSRFAASLALGLTSMTDPTTGFMALRRSILPRLQLDPIGWKIVLEVVVKAHPARLSEVPIVFTDREHGESKQSLRVLGQYLAHLYALYQFRFPALIELLKFCLVGLLGVFVDLAVVAALRAGPGLDPRLCQVGGFAAAVTFNYAVNRRFSFRHARETPVLYSYATYVAVNLFGLAVRMLTIEALVVVTAWERQPGYGYLLVSAVGVVLATLVNFVGVKFLAFAPERLAPAPEAPPDAARPPERGAGPVALGVALLSLGLVGAGVARQLAALGHPAAAALALPVLTQGALLAGGYLALSAFDLRGAVATVLLLASSPALLVAATGDAAEPRVAALGLLGFAGLARSEGSRAGPLLAALGGLALGLAFALGSWLALPAGLAALGWTVLRDASVEAGARPRVRRLAALAAGSTLLGAGAHLALVQLAGPAELGPWVARAGRALFVGDGALEPASGARAAAGASAWAYAGWLLRDHGALLAPIVFGLPAATRRLDGRHSAWIVAALFALVALVPLSVPAFKAPLHLLPALPFLHGLAGLCLAAAAQVPERHRRVALSSARASLWVAGLVTLGLIVAHGVAHGAALEGLGALGARVVHVGAWALPAGLALRGRSTARATWLAAALSLAAALAGLGLASR